MNVTAEINKACRELPPIGLPEDLKKEIDSFVLRFEINKFFERKWMGRDLRIFLASRTFQGNVTLMINVGKEVNKACGKMAALGVPVDVQREIVRILVGAGVEHCLQEQEKIRAEHAAMVEKATKGLSN